MEEEVEKINFAGNRPSSFSKRVNAIGVGDPVVARLAMSTHSCSAIRSKNVLRFLGGRATCLITLKAPHALLPTNAT